MAKIKVLLTYRQDDPFEVDEDEIPGLHSQGLIQPGELSRLRGLELLPPAPPAPSTPAGKPAAGKEGT